MLISTLNIIFSIAFYNVPWKENISMAFYDVLQTESFYEITLLGYGRVASTIKYRVANWLRSVILYHSFD
jgi:hypothetical protein